MKILEESPRFTHKRLVMSFNAKADELREKAEEQIDSFVPLARSVSTDLPGML